MTGYAEARLVHPSAAASQRDYLSFWWIRSAQARRASPAPGSTPFRRRRAHPGAPDAVNAAPNKLICADSGHARRRS